MTNELWMDLGKGFLYYKTNATSLKAALEEFLDKLDSINCIHDNFGWEEIEFRDPDLNPIESGGIGRPADYNL